MSFTMENDKTVIWLHFHNFHIDLATRLKIDLFPDCVIRSMDQFALYNKQDRNIVIYQFFFNEGSRDPAEDFSWADLVIHYTNEIIVGPWPDHIKRVSSCFKNNNIITLAGGHRNCYDYPRDKAYLDLLTFFSTMADSITIENHTMPSQKEKYFDVLLGTAKPHRVYLLDKIRKHGLEDRCLINMTKDIYKDEYNHDQFNYRSKDMDQYEDPAVIPQTQIPGFGSMETVKGISNGYNLSQHVPNGIYKNCWYSVVAETNPSGSTFFTEKTAKCLLTKRVFVFFGSHGQLAKLRDHGYKTFDPVIDESYDNVEDNVERWNMAFNQMLILFKKDAVSIYNSLETVLEHNYSVINDQKSRLTKLKLWIDKAINDTKLCL